MFNKSTLNIKQFRGQGFMTVAKYNYDGSLLFIGDKDSKYVSLVSTSSNQLVGTFNGHNGVIWHLEISKDSKYMISCSGDGTCMIWNVMTGENLNTISEDGIPKYVSINEDIIAIEFEPITRRKASYINIYSLDELVSGKINILYKFQESELNRATTITCISEDTILATYDNGNIKKINFKTQSVELEKKLHTESIKSIYFSNDKTKFLTGSLDSTSKIVKLETLEEVCTFKSKVPINSAVFTTDNEYVLLGGGIEAMLVAKTSDNDLTTKIYQVSNQKLIKQITNHFGPLRYLDFNPNGSSFATASQDGSVKIHYFNPVIEKTELIENFGYALTRDADELPLRDETVTMDEPNETISLKINKGDKKQSQESYPIGHHLHTVIKEASDYTISSKSKSNDNKHLSSVKVSNLPDDIGTTELYEMFDYYGRIENNGIKIKYLHSDTIAFVNYLNNESALKAIEKCNKKRFGHCIINVEMANHN
jgi:translation initiation factor 3 subunit I